MNLSDIFEENNDAEKVVDDNILNDIIEEIKIISKKHNVNCNDAFIKELAKIYMDSPPWYPWKK